MRELIQTLSSAAIGAIVAVAAVYAFGGPNGSRSGPLKAASESKDTDNQGVAANEIAAPQERQPSIPLMPELGQVQHDRKEASVTRPERWTPSIREERDIERKEESDFVAATQREPVDRAWAHTAEIGLGDTLKGLGTKAGFRVEETACHTTRCLSSVVFSNYEEARANFVTIAHARYEPNCGVAISLPEGESSGVEVRAQVRFDCEEARVREVSGTR